MRRPFSGSTSRASTILADPRRPPGSLGGAFAVSPRVLAEDAPLSRGRGYGSAPTEAGRHRLRAGGGVAEEGNQACVVGVGSPDRAGECEGLVVRHRQAAAADSAGVWLNASPDGTRQSKRPTRRGRGCLRQLRLRPRSSRASRSTRRAFGPCRAGPSVPPRARRRAG